jgi:hypothetical protein
VEGLVGYFAVATELPDLPIEGGEVGFGMVDEGVLNYGGQADGWVENRVTAAADGKLKIEFVVLPREEGEEIHEVDVAYTDGPDGVWDVGVK